MPTILISQWGFFHLLVHIFYHHNCTVDHRPYRYGNAAQRHYIGINTLQVHDDEGRENAYWQTDNGYQR